MKSIIAALLMLCTGCAAHQAPVSPAPPRSFNTLTQVAPCDTGLALYGGKLHFYTLGCDSIYHLLGPVKP